MGKWIDEHGGELVCVPRDEMLGRVRVIEREDEHFVDSRWRDTRGLRYRPRRLGVPDQVQRRSNADLSVVVAAVIAAFELGDSGATGEGARRLDGHHHRFSARIREADALDAVDAIDQQLSQADLALGGEGYGRAHYKLLCDCLHDARMGVAVNQRGVVVDEIQAALTVHIGDRRSLRRGHVCRVGRSEHGGARVAARHDRPRPRVQLSRARCRFQVAVAKRLGCKRSVYLGHVYQATPSPSP